MLPSNGSQLQTETQKGSVPGGPFDKSEINYDLTADSLIE